MNTSFVRIGIVPLVGLALLGAGCGSSSSNTNNASQAPTAQQQPTTSTPPSVAVTSTPAATSTKPTTTTVPKPTTYKQPKPTTTTQIPMNQTVVIQNMAFGPMVIVIPTGGTITWLNKDSVSHTSKSDGALLWDSGNIAPGMSFSHKFNAPGSYNYSCAIHPNMKGTVIVRDQAK